MTDANIIGKNSPLTAYVRLTFEDFTTGVIPPKYIQSFKTTRIKNKTGTYSIDLIYAANTFAQGDDYLGIKLSNSMYKLSLLNKDNSKINCTLEYGWYGLENLSVKFNQATISAFTETINNGAAVYHIEGVLNQSSSRGMKTAASRADIYDLDNDGDVDPNDWVLAITPPKNGGLGLGADFAGEVYAGFDKNSSKIFSTTTLDLINGNIIPAGKRLSDVIEVLAKYIFKDIYNVVVDHSDLLYEEQKEINGVITSGEGVTSGDTLMLKLTKLIENCYTHNGYNVTASYYIKGNEKAFQTVTDFIESDESVDESKYYNKIPWTIVDGLIGNPSLNTVINSNKNNQGNINLINYKNTTTRTNPKDRVEIKIETEPSLGDQFGMFFIDNDKYGKPTLKIGPLTNVYANSQFAHYNVSNKNKNNNVISYSHTSNLIPLITAFNYTFNNTTGDIDVDSGSISFTDFASKSSALTTDKLDSYAEQFAMQLIKHIDNTAKANLSVVFDRFSAMLGIDDRISITNTINGGNTLFNGQFYIYSVVDEINNGMLETSYELIYTKSYIQQYVKQCVLKLLGELNSKSKTS